MAAVAAIECQTGENFSFFGRKIKIISINNFYLHPSRERKKNIIPVVTTAPACLSAVAVVRESPAQKRNIIKKLSPTSSSCIRQ
jgi:hypothetical protein